MSENNWINFNGDLKPAGEKVITAESRGLMYGDGCFETFRSYNGRLFELEKHLSRLQEGLQYLGIRYPEALQFDALKALLHKLLKKNKLLGGEALIRMQVWRKGGRGYRTERPSQAHFSVVARSLSPGVADPVALAIVDTRRIPNQALPSRFKLSNGINYISAANEARDKGADDALMLTMEGAVAETTIANIFWVKDEIIYTPSARCDLLPGITRNAVLETIIKSADFKVSEGKYSQDEIRNADAVWVCNSVRELIPVYKIDDREYPTQHPVFEEIQRKFAVYRDQKLVPVQ